MMVNYIPISIAVILPHMQLLSSDTQNARHEFY